MKKRINILSCVAISAVVLSGMGITNVKADENTVVSIQNVSGKSLNPEVQNGGHVSDDFTDVSKNNLGYASKFHIFVNEATLNAHTNGNVAAKKLIGNVNFGTNITDEKLLDKDISYIQEVKNMAESSFVSANDHRTNKVIFGEVNDVELGDNSPLVNGTTISHLLNDEIYQDKGSNEYIDFAQEFAKLEGKSANYAIANGETITSDSFEDHNHRVIDLSDFKVGSNNQIVINLAPEVLNSNTPLTISGLSADAGGTSVIINVDTKGQNPYQMNSQIKLRFNNGEDGPVERPNQETEYFDDNHLLWNFYDSSSSNKQFTGAIEMNNTFQGSVLAPDATINVHHNLDGNIVANEVNVVGGETHRWDLQDNNNIVTTPEEPDEETDEKELTVDPGFSVDPDESSNPDPDEKDDEEEEEEQVVDPGFTIDPNTDTDEGTDEEDEEEETLINPDLSVDPGFGIDPGKNFEEDEDDDQQIIINGGSEGGLEDKELDLNSSIKPSVPDTVNEKTPLMSQSSMFPTTRSAISSTNESGKLPQAGNSKGILMSALGMAMLGLVVLVRKFKV
ncbi:collagen-binding domain-containing protein [Companilactobacillus sp. HBUAS56257]|uniref:collagen-binding domain-containing protein n=1 Tax=Companilactobacillus sp. HBUAS56257 TaxID=3109360 RepID=UPI002FF0DB35